VHAGGLFAAVLDARVDTPHDYSREMPIEPWAAIHLIHGLSAAYRVVLDFSDNCDFVALHGVTGVVL